MRQKRYNAGRKAGRLLVITLIAMAIGLLSTMYYVMAQMEDMVYKDVFYPGITVEGIDLGGMTFEEAKEAVAARVVQQYGQYGLRLKYKDSVWSFNHNDINISSDIEKVLKNAYEIGRSGALLERYAKIKGLKANSTVLDVKLSYDLSALNSKIRAIADEINVEPVDAVLTFHPGKAEKFTVSPDIDGIKLNVDELIKEINLRFQNSTFVEIELDPEILEPAVKAADLLQQTTKLAEFSTIVTGSDARLHNVYLSASAFDGMIIQPGQTVSYNETTGQRTIANGYKKAPVIMADKSLQDDLGGGVCQTSTTIYNAVVRAGLSIVERMHHSFPSTYVEIGHDAVVNWPNVDLKFMNNYDTSVYLHTYREGNKLHVEVYGKASDEGYDEIRLESDIYETYKSPAPKMVSDTDRKYVTYTDQKYTKVSSRPGYKVKTYRVFIKDGQEIRRELLSDDFYRPITGTVYVGITDREVITNN